MIVNLVTFCFTSEPYSFLSIFQWQHSISSGCLLSSKYDNSSRTQKIFQDRHKNISCLVGCWRHKSRHCTEGRPGPCQSSHPTQPASLAPSSRTQFLELTPAPLHLILPQLTPLHFLHTSWTQTCDRKEHISNIKGNQLESNLASTPITKYNANYTDIFASWRQLLQ